MKKPITCCKCKREIKVKRDTEREQEWNKYKGDKALWNRYSHVQVVENGTTSEPCKLDAIYRYGGGLNLNFAYGDSYHNEIALKEKSSGVYARTNGTAKFILLERKKINV